MIDYELGKWLNLGKVEVTEHGFEHNPLIEGAPQDVADKWTAYVREQDERLKNGEGPIFL